MVSFVVPGGGDASKISRFRRRATIGKGFFSQSDVSGNAVADLVEAIVVFHIVVCSFYNFSIGCDSHLM
jgi:hypothetical protein